MVRALLCALCAAVFGVFSTHAVAQEKTPAQPQTQTPGEDFDQIVNDDLQAQAQAAMSDGYRERALELLTELSQRDPRQAGALLDIAILYCQLGEQALSVKTLDRIEADYIVPPAISEVIASYRQSACRSVTPRPQFSVSVGVGMTSNANFGPSSSIVTFAPTAPFASLSLAPSSLPRSDQYVESAFQGELPIQAVPGLRLLGGLSDRQYRSVHNFDQRAVTLGIAGQKNLAQGVLYSDFTTNVLWLGTHMYQRDLGAHGGYWLPSTAWRSLLARAGLDLTVVDSAYPGNSLYDAIYFAVRAAFQAQLGERTSVQFLIGPAWDKPHGDRPGGMQHGYSGLLSLDYDMGRRGKLEATLQQRTLNDAAPYDQVFFGNLAQNQSVRVAALRYDYPLTRGWSLYAQMSAQRVTNSISLFAYTVYDGSVGVAWKY